MKLEDMNHLERIIEKALECDLPLGLSIEMPGFVEPELIINPAVNLKKKLEYYKDVYDENLEHRHAKGIKIVGFEFNWLRERG
ncbi:MAG TPA: hypothetical protein GX707_08395 [Epulopiscium sp.]|nr:hypothetical protein [Candidatus Epulonipiscium sp.]